MATIYTVGGNTSGGSTVVSNGGCVARKSYSHTYSGIHSIWRPKYKAGEAEKVAKEAIKYVGYLEKASNYNLENFTANAGYNNYNMFAPHALAATGSGVYVNGVAWCDIFADDMMIRALGATRTKQLIYGWSAYTPCSCYWLECAGAAKITDYSKATYGDIIFFKDSSGICHVEIVITGIDSASGKGQTSNTASSTTTTSSSYKEPTIYLSKGSSGEGVKWLQTMLNKFGYKLTVDGEFGPNTHNAVIAYQKSKGLEVDGIVGPATRKSLKESKTNKVVASTTYSQAEFIKDVCKILGVKTAKEAYNKSITLSTKYNTKHALVLPVQKYLASLKYYSGVPDKNYGTMTANAVKTYQEKVVKASKTNCDGIITKKNATWKKLLGL